MYCIIDGWYEDQRPENIMSLVAAVLTNSETEVYTGDVYVNNSHTEQLEHKEETYISKTANQYNFKENFQGVKLVESEMVSVISTLVTLAENHLTIEEREKTSMRMFITAFNSRKPHMLEEIDARYYKALDYIISSK
jgi:hypothetical protein